MTEKLNKQKNNNKLKLKRLKRLEKQLKANILKRKIAKKNNG
tara:strand:- start:332 stop:457 length:126 start_codon:yes stop_codon:yes gene_type:complete